MKVLAVILAVLLVVVGFISFVLINNLNEDKAALEEKLAASEGETVKVSALNTELEEELRGSRLAETALSANLTYCERSRDRYRAEALENIGIAEENNERAAYWENRFRESEGDMEIALAGCAEREAALSENISALEGAVVELESRSWRHFESMAQWDAWLNDHIDYTVGEYSTYAEYIQSQAYAEGYLVSQQFMFGSTGGEGYRLGLVVRIGDTYYYVEASPGYYRTFTDIVHDEGA